MRTTGGRPAPIVNFNADYNLADADCVAMSYDTSDSTETAFEQSRWVLDECDVDGSANDEGVICMERTGKRVLFVIIQAFLKICVFFIYIYHMGLF